MWLDASGRSHAAPATVTDSVGNAGLIGAFVLIGLGTVVLTGGALVGRRLDRIDDRNWDREWQRVDSEWTRRR